MLSRKLARFDKSTKMQNYKVLSNSAGVRVSPICLGAMNFGTSWKEVVGECTKEEAFKIMDVYYKAGGNFIDTSNNYQYGESEIWVGEWMKARNNREEIVLATKYGTMYKKHKDPKILINYTGNDSKSLKCSVENSLKNLQTDYIDLLYVHWWDYSTSIPELMQSLNRLIASKKVLYLGIADSPAWVVSAANTYAKDHGLSPFVVYQGKWNVAEPDIERDILPMCRAYGMAVAPWSVLLSGRSETSDQTDAGKGRSEMALSTERMKRVLAKVLFALEVAAGELNATRQQVCIAYVIKKEPQTIPVICSRKASHLLENLKALDIVDKINDKQMIPLELASEFEFGFPHDLLGNGDFTDNFMMGGGDATNYMEGGGVYVQDLKHSIYQG